MCQPTLIFFKISRRIHGTPIPSGPLVQKLCEDLIQSSSPLEFGQDISHVLEGCTFLQDTMASFEEMIAPGFMF